MYTVYLDESGTTQGQEAVTVAGCVSSNKKWKRLETEWRAILSEYGVSVFHMADCAGKRREYSAANGWDSQRRKAFLSELAECAAKHVQYAASITIPVRDFAEAAREINLKPGDRSEFLAAGRTTIHILCNWIKKKGANPDQAGYFFEKGVTAGIGNLQTLVKMRQGIALEQTPKSNVCGYRK